jgi:cell fate regulator YaaT (PSP1 superfamily)
VVSLSGELVRMQMKKKNIAVNHPELKKVYRKAKQTDIDKWQAAKDLEVPTMYKARTLALKLKLQMKISDVEYQGDKTKAIFYYTADERVDFRELIKLMADEFKIRIEMKQIGARQEASRLGGIGSCGRELCCSTWLTDFRSVSTSAARYQQLSLNPLKLAGQCGKLKCCLNYELDSYLDALKDIPDGNTKLETQKGRAYCQKTDIFKRMMWFTYADDPSNFIPVPVDKVNEILALNKAGEKPEDISIKKEAPKVKLPDFENVVGQDSLTRFDNAKKKKKKKKKKPVGANAGNAVQQADQKEKPIAKQATAQVREEGKGSKPAQAGQQGKQHRNNRNRNRKNPNENAPGTE